MDKRNYKVYANLGFNIHYTSRYDVLLESGGGVQASSVRMPCEKDNGNGLNLQYPTSEYEGNQRVNIDGTVDFAVEMGG